MSLKYLGAWLHAPRTDRSLTSDWGGRESVIHGDSVVCLLEETKGSVKLSLKLQTPNWSNNRSELGSEDRRPFVGI